MSLTSPGARRPRSRRLLLAVAIAALTGLGALAQSPASAAVLASAPAARAAAPAAHAASAPRAASALVSDLAVTGTRTSVTVRRIYRTGQKLWVDHIVETWLVNVDGCQARRSGTTWQRHVYRSSVNAVCPQGAVGVEAAAAALVRSRPWYRVTVEKVPLVGFTLLADLPVGNDRAVPAAVAQLPSGPAVFFEGDDVSLSYAGPGVTQTQLDAALAAFAQALGVPAAQVTVSRLAG